MGGPDLIVPVAKRVTLLFKEPPPRWQMKPGVYYEDDFEGRRRVVTTGDGVTASARERLVEDKGPATGERPIMIPGVGLMYRDEMAELVERAREMPAPEHPDPTGRIMNNMWHDHLLKIIEAGRGRTHGTSITKDW